MANRHLIISLCFLFACNFIECDSFAVEELVTESVTEISDSDNIKQNGTKDDSSGSKEKHDLYYNITVVKDEEFTQSLWESFKDMEISETLYSSYRRTQVVRLSFDFPFYGHPIRNVTIATGGFLYTGEYVHSWLAATQYIAPLMANFDTSLSDDSLVKFSDNGTAFTVIWENVSLQDKPEVGKFTFSATLYQNGDIVFAYFSVPVSVSTISTEHHPVKVGVSDAYLLSRVVFYARRKTIYEYHRVNLIDEITNSTIIYLNAEPTCLSFTDCSSCLQQTTSFNCSWCPALNKCSSGIDRGRQNWMEKNCNLEAITDASLCTSYEQEGYHTLNESVSEANKEVEIELTESNEQEGNHTLNESVSEANKEVEI